MDICSTIWCSTDPLGAATVWSALITFTGTVVGAVVVGLLAFMVGKRQLELMERQAQIQLGLLEHERNKIRVDLLDRRLKIVGARDTFINHLLIHDRMPGRGDFGTSIPETRRKANEVKILNEFIQASDAAVFLFESDIHSHLNRIYREARRHAFLKRKLERVKDDEANKVRLEFAVDDSFEKIEEIDKELTALFRMQIKPVSEGAITMPVGMPQKAKGRGWGWRVAGRSRGRS